MLLLVRSRGVVFTAFITSMLSRTVQGQVIVLMMITSTSHWWYICCVVFSASFVCKVCKTGQENVYHVDLEAICETSMCLRTTFLSRRSVSGMKSEAGKRQRKSYAFNREWFKHLLGITFHSTCVQQQYRKKLNQNR